MTTNATDISYDLGVNLEEDPELNILSWKLKVQEVASSLATSVSPSGLLTHILDNQEWQDHLANRSTSPGGTITVAPRPVSPAHVPIVNGMNANAIAVAKYTNDRRQIWHEAKNALKRCIVDSMGPTLAAAFGPPPHGFTLRSIRQILTDINTKFANVDAVALEALEEHLITPLESMYGLEKHISRLTRYILMSESAGFPIEQYRRVRIFRKSVQGHHQIARTLETFDDRFPNPKTHTFLQVTTWVREKLPPILTAAGKPKALHVGTTVPSPLPEVVDLQRQLVALTATIATLQETKKRGNRGNNPRRDKSKRRATDRPARDRTRSTAPTAESCEQYCFAHGHQNSHSSSECRLMENQKDRFTRAMRNATGPNNPPGGSAAILGQPRQFPPTAVQGNMFQRNESARDDPTTPPRTTPTSSSTARSDDATTSSSAVNDWIDAMENEARPFVGPHQLWRPFTWGQGQDDGERS
jgi:hypothetical protein